MASLEGRRTGAEEAALLPAPCESRQGSRLYIFLAPLIRARFYWCSRLEL